MSLSDLVYCLVGIASAGMGANVYSFGKTMNELKGRGELSAYEIGIIENAEGESKISLITFPGRICAYYVHNLKYKDKE